MNISSYQRRSRLPCAATLVMFLLVLLTLTGCNNQQPSAIPTPDLDILAPTATGVTARVEVVIVVVTATAEPTTAPSTAPSSPPTENATPTAEATPMPAGEAAAEEVAAVSPTATAAPTTATTTESNTSTGGQAQAQTMSNQELINRGEEIYSENCATCHQPDGEGTDLYPALNQSGLLDSGDPTQAIQLVLHGRGEMPAFEDTLSNQQIASVLSYERNAWQNDAAVVRVAQVRQVRQGGSASTGQASTGDAMAAQAEPTESATAETNAPSATATEAMTATSVPSATPAATTESSTPESDTSSSPTATAPAQPEATASPALTPTAGNQANQRGQDLLARGQRIYAANCATCHRLNGQGQGEYPALAGSALLTADDPSMAIQFVLYGHEEMPAFADELSSEDVAAVLSHERNSWGNNAANVTVEQVEQIRQAQPSAQTGEAATTGEPTAEMVGTATVTTTMNAPEPAGTPVPSATVSNTVVGPTVSLTWTPARAVTPLLPTAELSATTTTGTPAATAETTGTPTPADTAAATGSVAMTETVTPSPQATITGTATAESTTDAVTVTGTPNAGAANAEQLISRGEAIYAEHCASCHQINGEGNTTYPALNGSELLTADDPTAAIERVLYGQGEMPAFEDELSVEEIAAVLSHERNAWDNNASVVTVEQVQAVSGN